MQTALLRAGSRRAAFSMVEVVLAIGVVAFALLAILGALPIGLKTVQESMFQAAKANIVQQLRGELQQISFNTGSGSTAAFNISNLSQTNYYYGEDGMVTSPEDAYYKATFAVGDATVVSASGTSASFEPTSAKTITVTLWYPQHAPEANQQRETFSIFSAKQKSH